MTYILYHKKRKKARGIFKEAKQMSMQDKTKFINLIRALPEKKKKEFYYMVMGAAFVAQQESEV